MRTRFAISLFLILPLFTLPSCEDENKEAFRKYTSLLSQEGMSNPTEVVLQNELNRTIMWTRLEPGKYEGKLSRPITLERTTIVFQVQAIDRFVTGGFEDAETIRIDVCMRSFPYITNDTFENLVIEIKAF